MQAYKIDVRGTTEREKKDIQDALFKLGYRWRDGGNPYNLTQAGVYFTTTSGVLTYSFMFYENDVRFQFHFDEHPNKEITISELMTLAYGENMNKDKEFTKSDLKTGMVVRMRGGSYEADLFGGLCVVIADCLIQSNVHEPLETYNNDLIHRSFNQFDIVEVFEVISTVGRPLEKIQQWGLKSVWKRNELTEQLRKLNAEKDKLLLKVKEIDGKIAELESK